MERNIFVAAGRGRSAAPRFRLVWGKRSIPVQRIWTEGLAIDAGEQANVPGLAALYRGSEQVASVLLISDTIEAGEHRFNFKRMTPSAATPPLDYALEPDPIAALPSPDRARQGI